MSTEQKTIPTLDEVATEVFKSIVTEQRAKKWTEDDKIPLLLIDRVEEAISHPLTEAFYRSKFEGEGWVKPEVYYFMKDFRSMNFDNAEKIPIGSVVKKSGGYWEVFHKSGAKYEVKWHSIDQLLAANYLSPLPPAPIK